MTGLSMPRQTDQIDWRCKGFLTAEKGENELAQVLGRSIFDGPFTWPLLTLSASAVEHNVAQLARFCRDHKAQLAPHAKTTMAPTLIQLQLEAGAWGVTVATANQALVVRHFGARRVLLANELLEPRALRRLAAEADSDPDFELFLYIDSVAGVHAVSNASGSKPFHVLVEFGRPGGRTGCRDISSAREVAHAAMAAGLDVAGVAGYEGGLPDEQAVRRYLQDLRAAVVALHAAGVLAAGRLPIVTAGGSTWFDIVADELTRAWPPEVEVQTVLRSGAYVGHDDGFYREGTPYATRIDGELKPALRLWAQVLSTPEPGLAIAGFGKRDASYDLGLPMPLFVRATDGRTRPVPGVVVTKMDDQHAYLEVAGQPPDGPVLKVGDLIAFGLSHPCTVFDKWTTIPMVDDDDRVLDVLHTYF